MAESLGKTIGEIEDMSHFEFAEWAAYFTVKQEKSRGG